MHQMEEDITAMSTEDLVDPMDPATPSISLENNYFAQRCASLKSQYEGLHRHYTELVLSDGLLSQKLISAQEAALNYQTECNRTARDVIMSTKELDSLKMSWILIRRQLDQAVRQCEEAKQRVTKAQLERDEALNRLNRTIDEKIQTHRDLARLTKERNEAVKEYNLVMSERNGVHEEMEKIHQECLKYKERVKMLELDNKRLSQENGFLRKQFLLALLEQERRVKEANVGGFSKLSSWWSSFRHSTALPSDTSFSSGTNCPVDSSDNLSCNSYNIRTSRESETKSLKSQIVGLQKQLELTKEELLLHQLRQGWSFNQKLKAALEKSSVTTLCNQYRREREKALMDLAKALADMNEAKQEKEKIHQELREYKARFETLSSVKPYKWPKSFRHSIHGESKTNAAIGREDIPSPSSLEIPSSCASSVENNSTRSTGRSKLSEKLRIFSRKSKADVAKKICNLDYAADCGAKQENQTVLTNKQKENADSKRASLNIEDSCPLGSAKLGMRRIQLSKCSGSLGIELASCEGGGVYISSIRSDSLASKSGLQLHDQLLEVCGINMRNASHHVVAHIVKQCGESLELLVQSVDLSESSLIKSNSVRV